jgi:hypothetical protein
LGYIGLNKYLYAIGRADSPECEDCREEETVEHYLLHSERFREPKDRLSSKIFKVCREWILSLDMLLGVSGRTHIETSAWIHASCWAII